jgi:prevent-host-death family protein
VDTIPQKQLRNEVGDVLRRVEAGETFTVTVAGRPVAELGPAHRRRWVGGSTLAKIWHGPAPRRREDDLARRGAELGDPFTR